MNYYEKELRALKRSGRFRTREIANSALYDFASNDYLGLAHYKVLHQQTCKQLEKSEIHAPKASLLVGGYHKEHRDFERALCRSNGFEEAIVVGSGFAANIALIEALVRKGDVLIMDASYHASGVLASNIGSIDKKIFEHNDMAHLEKLLAASRDKKRRIVAVEGVYSMEGDIVPKEVFDLCAHYDAILIVDEAHSSGVVGENLLGVYDLYEIEIAPNHIKMGTLGKAYGSFGAYILASEHIVSYLLNRAKPLIYATALSLYDTVLGHRSLLYIQEHKERLKKEIEVRQRLVKEILERELSSLILPIPIGDNKRVIEIKKELETKGFAIGAIREPTVPSAILRIIARLGEDATTFERLLIELRNYF